LRAKAVYDLDLRFTKQRLLGGYHYRSSDPIAEIFSEFVDPVNPRFKGQLINANTLEAYRNNITVLNQNRVNRRFYLRDGDDERSTTSSAMRGSMVMLGAISSGDSAGSSTERYLSNSGCMVGHSGRYFK